LHLLQPLSDTAVGSIMLCMDRADAYSVELFRAQAHGVVDQLADYLSEALRGDPMPVLSAGTPDELLARWPDQFPSLPAADAAGALKHLLAGVLVHSNHLHHPHYAGHQVTAPLPQAAITEFISALLNNAMAVYEMGPAATAMERSLIRWLGSQCGWNRLRLDGVMTSGGSAGNLTALLAARQERAGYDAWHAGQSGGPPLAFLGGASAHYSVQRAVQIMGWGHEGLIPVAVDERFKMRAEGLEAAFADAGRRGRKIIGVVASACSTATGSFDPLEPVADFCRRQGLWMHVDGAHGAVAALSPKYRHLVKGIERADSVVWDAHKMMLMPAPATAVLFRNGESSSHAFAQQASYLFTGAKPESEWFNVGQRTLECTKRQMSLHLYAALLIRGTQFFSDYVTGMFDLGRKFGEMLGDCGDFEVPVAPECNIVCFRYKSQGAAAKDAELDALNAAIRQRIVASGKFYIVQTKLSGRLHLRVTLINPATTEASLIELMAAVREAAAEMAKG
jgi:L-2,4-diaminobutyrate decarboxylase